MKIKIPKYYKENVINMFGNIGKTWLNKLPEIIDKYITKFSITNLRINENLTFNIILFGNCKKYGDIVLKIGLPFNELLIRESKALNYFNGNSACKCYYYNEDDGVLLLEYIYPSIKLSEIDDLKYKIKLFSDVVSSLQAIKFRKIDLPTYREIFYRSLDMSKKNADKFKLIINNLDIAINFFKDIEKAKFPETLLHADLNEDNILVYNGLGKVIDPHGFIGETIFETSRFTQKLILKTEITEEEILRISNLVNSYFNYDINLFLKALYIDYVLTICWDIEVNNPDSYIKEELTIAKKILNCIK